MPLNRIELIQGPPGTGKTTTIVGIVKMLLSSDPSLNIQICAPSNAAVDQIMPRMIKYAASSGINCKLLRIGAKCFQASEEI